MNNYHYRAATPTPYIGGHGNWIPGPGAKPYGEPWKQEPRPTPIPNLLITLTPEQITELLETGAVVVMGPSNTITIREGHVA